MLGTLDLPGYEECVFTPINDSSRLFLIKKGEQKKVLRLLKKENAHEYACLEIASKCGYGPKIELCDEEKGICIMEYLSIDPFHRISEKKLITLLAEFLRKMHRGPSFAKRVKIMDQIAELFVVVKTRNGYLNKERASQIELNLKKMSATFEDFSHLAPCHRDLNSTNVIFSKGNFYAIDFETASQDDPFFDLATLANSYFGSSATDSAFLKAYFGRNPTQKEETKLHLMRLVVLIFYALGILNLVGQDASAPQDDITSFEPLMTTSVVDKTTAAYKLGAASCMLNMASKYR